MDFIYGGRRVTVAPHKHGRRARRTSTVDALWVVLEGSARELPLTVDLPDGREAMALFSGEEEARMLCHFCEEGASLNIRQATAGEVLWLLYCPWCAAKHVVLDPFPEILGERLLGLLTLDRVRFARCFAGVEPELVAGEPVGPNSPDEHRIEGDTEITSVDGHPQRKVLPKFDYRLDESDPDVLVLKREDGSFVAAFSAQGATRESILEAAKEDYARVVVQTSCRTGTQDNEGPK